MAFYHFLSRHYKLRALRSIGPAKRAASDNHHHVCAKPAADNATASMATHAHGIAGAGAMLSACVLAAGQSLDIWRVTLGVKQLFIANVHMGQWDGSPDGEWK